MAQSIISSQTPPSEKKHRQSSKDLFKLIIAIVIIGLLGVGSGYYYSQLPKNNPQKNQSNCEQAGGDWENEKCLLSNRLTGEECIDGGQCQSGICFPPELTEEQIAELAEKPLTDITGTCYSEELIEECVKQVNNGTVSLESLCYE
ncbi:MAG: hypothetical protein COY66_01855 [Candidatus Kerfeldbacteria bacterium CG_4_10_14_0_8_um_filter_42_10]|uniref:Uncharacterized protein n=1 Tax=Candidatus Kerfeldbacteria bacterium CG_4_10_14_0_8_um_filter_42_10 TaxID=2014248 RepID=A0A2M7RKC7_9BACT|nr:MAG: hypothetical protein COY66_01855 [Candidatus Kerfeldbacteria bacterium CG_4_10_14_0_8_um_filter_42_10]